MHIKRLQLQNFKCFETLDVDFDDIPGLYQIRGNIGSGKTTIAEGILFAIYGTINGKKNGDLIRWGTKHGKTNIMFEANGHEIVIDREMNSYGQSPMSVFVDGEPMECPDKRFMQKTLEDEYLDVSRQVMELLCVISFNNFNSLSQMNTKTTRLFLDNVLGLDLVTAYSECAKQMAIDYKSTANDARVHIMALESEKARNNTPKTLVGGFNEQEIQDHINNINQHIKDAREEAGTLEAEQTKKMAEINDRKLTITNKKAEIVAIGKKLASEIKFIERGTCPTCGAPIDQSHLSDKIKERDLLRESLKDQNEKEANISNEVSAINNAILSIREDLRVKLAELDDKMSKQRNIMAMIKAQRETQKWADERLAKLEIELKQYKTTFEDNEQKCNKFSELSTIISTTIRSKIMEGIVPVINKYCQLLADSVGMDFCPIFDSEFDCSIRRGTDEVSRASLSTGQGKMVDTIIILAILVSIARHVNCNVMLMDELMSNLDNDARSQLLFAIKQYMTGKTILIVSHQDLDKTTLDGMIKITRDTNNSSEMMIEKYGDKN